MFKLKTSFKCSSYFSKNDNIMLLLKRITFSALYLCIVHVWNNNVIYFCLKHIFPSSTYIAKCLIKKFNRIKCSR